MKKYKLNISIRKGLQDRFFETYEVDLLQWTESFKIKDLTVYDKDAYLVFSLEGQNEEENE